MYYIKLFVLLNLLFHIVGIMVFLLAKHYELEGAEKYNSFFMGGSYDICMMIFTSEITL